MGVFLDKIINSEIKLNENLNNKIVLLARSGLVEKEDFSIFKIAMKNLEDEKVLTVKQREIVQMVLIKLIDIIISDTTLFNKVKREL